MPKPSFNKEDRIFEPELTPITFNMTGEEHRPENPIAISNAAAGTTIITGHDLTKKGKLVLTMKDQGGATAGRGWQDAMYDTISITNVGQFFIWNYDNDYLTVVITDAATGTLRFTDAGREAEYVTSTLFEIK